MSDPMKIRATNANGVTEVRVLMSHPMETGQRKDAAGKTVPAHYITEVTAAKPCCRPTGRKLFRKTRFCPSSSKAAPRATRSP
jgi:hypothetical protein